MLGRGCRLGLIENYDHITSAHVSCVLLGPSRVEDPHLVQREFKKEGIFISL